MINHLWFSIDFALIFIDFSCIFIDYHWFSLIFIHFHRFMTIIMVANIFSNSSPAKSYKSISVILDPLNARWPRASNAPNPIAFWWLKPEKIAGKIACTNTHNIHWYLYYQKKTSLYSWLGTTATQQNCVLEFVVCVRKIPVVFKLYIVWAYKI